MCLASGFYPDHVTVSWQINGFNESRGVMTDDAAKKKDDGYTITSMLRVPASKWLKKGTNFTCIVHFFNGNETIPYSKSVIGPGNEATREKYLRITQSAKLSYTVLVFKSSIYGLFLVLLMWKLQASSKKQPN
ncbi:T cell receptor beta constant 2 isoform X2 [Fundulus heteroclitus]|nr:T cell receptor beta constant 2 isoform X2 [Fundulus heteroclitus]